MRKLVLFVCALLSVNIMTAQKNVLLEEATGTWCQYCPMGIYYIDSLHNTYDNVIAVAIHTSDAMANEEYYNASGLTQAPSANIGRRHTGLLPEDWFSNVQQEMNVAPKASVSVENQFDEATRVLTSSIHITALQNISGYYNVAGIVTEDAVTGPAPQYNQANLYSNAFVNVGGFENLPNPVPANRMAFDHVARQLLGGYNGEFGIPTSFAAGETYTHTFSYVLPESYDPKYIRVIGAVIEQESGLIDNAGISTYLDGNNNAAPKFISTPVTENYAFVNYIYNIYVHDTDDSNLTVSVEEKPEWLTFEQYDNKSAAIYGTPETAGEYEVVIKISDGKTETLQEYTLVVSEPLDASWEYLGEPNFSESSVYMNLYGSCAHNGNVYIFAKEYGYPSIYKYDPETEEWNKLISPAEGMAYEGDITVDNNGTVYIAYPVMGDQQDDYDDLMRIMKYEGGEWWNVGEFNRAGSIPKLAVDSQNRLLLGFKDYTANSRFYVYRFENEEWHCLGNDVSSGLWSKLAVDSNDVPYVSWVDSYAGNLLFVSKLEGDTWVKVSNDAVSEDFACYYYQDMAIDSVGNIYIAYSENSNNTLTTLRYNGSEWENIGSELTNLSIKGIDVAMDNQDNFYVTFSDMNMENRISVMKYDGAEWSFVGQRAFSGVSDYYLSMTMLHNYPCVVYTEATNNNYASAMYYTPYDFLYPPYNLIAYVTNENDVVLEWQAQDNSDILSYNIYRNDSKIANVSEKNYLDQDLIPSVYRYTVSAVYEDGESAVAGPVKVEIVVSIEEENEIAFMLYPNPAENYITLESLKQAEVKIYSINGQLISQESINEGNNIIDLSDFNPGMYFFEINGTMVKVVKR